jgi:hypothetical protein
MPGGRTAQERGYQGGFADSSYGMILERKELPCKSADGAPFNSKFRRPRDAGWRKEGMVQPWRTLGTVVAHTVSKEGGIFCRAPFRPC